MDGNELASSLLFHVVLTKVACSLPKWYLTYLSPSSPTLPIIFSQHTAFLAFGGSPWIELLLVRPSPDTSFLRRHNAFRRHGLQPQRPQLQGQQCLGTVSITASLAPDEQQRHLVQCRCSQHVKDFNGYRRYRCSFIQQLTPAWNAARSPARQAGSRIEGVGFGPSSYHESLVQP